MRLVNFRQIGRLGGTLGEREIKYLLLIPMNGDPIEFIPEVERVYAEGQAIEIQLPHVHRLKRSFEFQISLLSSMNPGKETSSNSWLTSTLKSQSLPSLEFTLQLPGSTH